MTFAGYNAGRGRVQQWVKQYGDPRDPKVDAIDWVERIPFAETRNYVQRVMENLQVYQSVSTPARGRCRSSIWRRVCYDAAPDHSLRKIRELGREVLGELNRSLGKLFASEGRPSIFPEQREQGIYTQKQGI